jgi:hypothetical protein
MQPQPIYHERLAYSTDTLIKIFGISALFGVAALVVEALIGVVSGDAELGELADWRLLAYGAAFGVGTVLLVLWFSRGASISVSEAAVTVTSGGGTFEYPWQNIRRYSCTRHFEEGGDSLAAIVGASHGDSGYRVARPGGDTVSAADPIGGFHGDDSRTVLVEFANAEKARVIRTNQPDQLMAALRSVAPEKEHRSDESAHAA